jgi:hypothetical protein
MSLILRPLSWGPIPISPKRWRFFVIGSGIGDSGTCGEKELREVAERRRKIGVKLKFSGLEQGALLARVRRGSCAAWKNAFFPN